MNKPTWKDIAEVHKHVSEARLKIIKEQQETIKKLEKKVKVIREFTHIMTINK